MALADPPDHGAAFFSDRRCARTLVVRLNPWCIAETLAEQHMSENLDANLLQQHRSALRGISRGGFAGVPYALNLELYFSVFKADLVLSLRGVGI